MIAQGDMTGPCIAERRNAGPKAALQLVGGKRLQRSRTGQQQGRHRDQAASPGDRVDKSGHKGRKDQQRRKVTCDLKQQSRPANSLADTKVQSGRHD